MKQQTYNVPGISCEHCRIAITTELRSVPGVESVQVDLERKRVTLRGAGVSEAAVRAAIDDAGYDVEGAVVEGADVEGRALEAAA